MNMRFRDVIQSLEPSFRSLLEMAPVDPARVPRGIPLAGVYLFSEGGRHLYVGRSRNIRKRIAGHCRPSAKENTAALAFRMARRATGIPATYTREGSRSDLLKNAAFSSVFDAAKKRIRNMDLRFVEESDPLRQALLEIYVAVSLDTPYNDFDTY